MMAARPISWVLGGAIIALAALWIAGSPALAAALCLIVAVLWRFGRELRMLRNELSVTRRERAVLEEALRQSQKMEAVGRLAAGITHDFNNHLTVISSNIELVKRRLDDSQERLIRHLDAAMQGVQRAALLTGRLMSFSRQPTRQPEAVEVSQLLDRLSSLLRRTLGEDVGLQVLLSDEQHFVWTDAIQMENALLSLAVNARDRIPPGGVLTVSVNNAGLDEDFVAAHPGLPPGDYVCIGVSDTTQAQAGFETSSEMVGHWQRADDPLVVGLSLARGFVREAGGCLLRSGSANGPQSLCLFLPRYRPPSPVRAVTRNPEDRLRILVVEDDAAVRGVCVETLREVGYEVLEAPDAMEAFRLIADHGGIDLLFTDLGLPGGVSGRALADAARNVDPGIRVLFITGYGSPEFGERSDTALLRKPFNPAQLADKVSQLLSTPAVTNRAENVRD